MSPIKVLHLITGIDVGGAENLLLSTLMMIDRQKFEVNVCYLQGRGELHDDFELKGIRTLNLGKDAASLPGKVLHLVRLLKHERYDIVHTHLLVATLVGRIAARLAGVPVVISTEHNTSNWRPRYFVVSWLYRRTAKYNRRILAISEAVKRCLTDIGRISPEKIEVLYDGIDVRRFNPETCDSELRHALGLDRAYPIVGSIGRLDPRKGHRYLIRAIAHLTVTYPNITLMLVGDGRERKALQRLVKSLHIEPNVVFAGTRRDVANCLSLLDVFVLPSLHEGLSIALIEAMAMKRAIVGTDVGGIPEVIEHGKEGILVEPGDGKKLAEAIHFVLVHHAAAEEMKISARRKVEERFDLKKQVRRLETIYEESLSGPNA